MYKNIGIILAAVLVVALPFVFRQKTPLGAWRPGDPVLVVVTPHIAAIRDEFAEGFSRWHSERYGAPVRLDWRAIGGTTEIMRYLRAEYAVAYRAYRRSAGRSWPEYGNDFIFDGRFRPDRPPDTAAEDDMRDFERRKELWLTFRGTDNPADFGCGIDVFFGGGSFDHAIAAAQGLTVEAWPAGGEPEGLILDSRGRRQIPAGRGGETWCAPHYYGAALSAFGICHNPDRLRDLGITSPPIQWTDLADPRYFGQLGLTDPTKSGSVAKAFEMIVHTECHRAVARAGFSADDIARNEALIREAGLPDGRLPPEVPPSYQGAVEAGWLEGVKLIRILGANARYFTDGAGKVPVDVAAGDAAAGLSIDFYSRVQAEVTRSPAGDERLVYVTPTGGSGVSADPISLMRGAPRRELGLRFMEYVLSTEGQKLWNYRPGEPGGPRRHALRRLPIRREFYASDDPELQTTAEEHARHTSDALTDPAVDAYRLSEVFEYIPRWTGPHFGFFRMLVRSMCLESGDELRRAWRAILDSGGPRAQPEAMRLLEALPEKPLPVNWENAAELTTGDRLETARLWTGHFRETYRAATAEAERPPH